ncbi:MAG: phospho-N-acetylmuramoyl-pentapeptide-transferase [Planctomycetota bacterium]|nr:MAG: phospho-N-acetylmuramoyl-pentapeptide-transferase [Planctomycetota bacterium]
MSLSIRSLLALVISFGVVIIFGPWWIAYLRRKKLGETTDQTDSERLNQIHSTKKGTPSMGGFLILLGTGIASLIVGQWNFYLFFGLATLFSFGAIGFHDDWKKIQNRGGQGLLPKQKVLLQMGLSFSLGLALYLFEGEFFLSSLASRITISLLPFWILFAMFVITGSSNSVNLTDGLDGLASGSSLPVFAALMVVAFISGQNHLSSLFAVHFIPGAEEMGLLIAALIGGILGFLWFNCYPAQIFMGDTGSLAIGAFLGASALALNQAFLLILLAIVFVIETLSVILQVASYKLFKKRIFKIAPIHHHFQFEGLEETKITVRFWIISTIAAFGTLLTFVGA